MYEKLMSSGIPCLILCRGHEADDDLIEAGRKYNVPVLMTEWTTSRFDAELTRWLNVQLAPCITIHGVLVDVYGEGVLIMGESGIGKSEAALELIKRGHRRIIAFLPTLRTGSLPQSTNLRIVFLPIPVHSAASSMVKPILMLLILSTSFQNTHFATMYL